MLATLKRVRTVSQRVQLIASIAVLVLLLLLSSLILASQPRVGPTSPQLSGNPTSPQLSGSPTCVPVATNGRGHIPAAGAGSC